MKVRKIIMFFTILLGLVGSTAFMQPSTVSASSDSSNISIDGNFDDWKNANLTEGYNGYTAMVSDGHYVDVYVKMKDSIVVPGHGDYDFTIDGKTYHVWTEDIPNGSKKQITFTGGEQNDNNQYGTVGSGYVSTEDGHNVAEFRIDLSKFGLSDVSGKQISMSNPNIGSDASTVIVGSDDVDGVISGKGDKNAKDDTTTDANADNTNDNLNIKIDGQYQDWKNIQLTEGYNGYTAMVSDGHYVYVYVKMKYGMVPGYGDYNFDIGGKKVYVWTDQIPGTLDKDQTKAIDFTAGDYNEGHQYGTVGNGYVTNDGQHNVGEFRIDLSKLDISTMVGQTITMYNPNIGNEKVTTSGGSTGPILISSIGVLIAGFGYIKLRKAGYLKKGSRISGK